MKRSLLAILLLLALAGLVFIQFRLLVMGVRLEKLRFDHQTELAVQAVGDTLSSLHILGDATIARLKMGEVSSQTKAFLPDSLDGLFSRELLRVGISARPTFALTGKYDHKPLLTSNHFNEENFKFNRYAVPLGDRVVGVVHQELILHLYVEDLFGYLLWELDYLLLPSIFCLLAILLCLALLINTLRKAEKLNLLKNDFINNLAHELKTPAFSIALSSRLAKESLEKNNPTAAGKYLQIIDNENNRIKNHVEKVLELASLEVARIPLQKTPADLHEIIQTTATSFARQAEGRGGAIKIVLDATDFIFQIDRSLFQNLLENLLDNALKYGGEKPHIEMATASDGTYFFLSVKDNGPGIAPAEHKFVFDKFYRSPRHSNAAKGFGLGLSFVKQIAALHGGEVTLESRLGEGALFRVALPLGGLGN